MKNILKKNQIIITALAIMIVIAGYLSFTKDDIPKAPDAVETDNPDLDEHGDISGMEGLEVVENTDKDNTDEVSPDGEDDETDKTVETDEDEKKDDTDETTPVDTGENVSELGDISDEDIMETAKDVKDTGELDLNEEGVPGEAVLVSTVIDQGYFMSNKVDREQMRSRNRNTLREMIESPDVDETLKKDYTNKLIELTEISEKEKATEILLGARGFSDALVVINEGKADIIVNTPSLTDQQLTIIESIVKDKTDIAVENITIVPVVAEE